MKTFINGVKAACVSVSFKYGMSVEKSCVAVQTLCLDTTTWVQMVRKRMNKKENNKPKPKLLKTCEDFA